MFSLRDPRRSFAFYAEWTLFVVLIAALLALWWILSFGLPNRQGTEYSVPEQVVHTLLAGTTTPQPIPTVVMRSLSAPQTALAEEKPSTGKKTTSGAPASLAASSTASSTIPSAPPAQALQFLTKK